MDGVFIILILGFALLMIASLWVIFEKAGYSGWLSIIPIVNIFVLAQVSGNPWWIVILMIIPVIGFFVSIYITFSLAERFGQGFMFFLGLLFFPVIFYPVLAFGGAEYSPKL